ncbi:uncharacterized protein AKAW2_10766S [Aspergillus luchuensis]|uniref:Similar to An02g08990 n=1 Tax=Aspergillus kawachii TaxID=1069201 RepID=A0A146FC83_ASPKA|nr:uncharacterized protein AKAW2_10766S [Aspergillus luchuensis]BCR93720.1 hypothetical protein AKAW2_10766S [Aspergillus luchuensis]BCS06348.1 hypothetical protein ALUC_10729S [Aspergillus luchuensis]GAA84627.1 similar to An02g08990 [Aspergillus luchuensis IFO 4308]GAT23660.1 similar to An02g08990 [Aspergillus luchuensis]
MQQFTQWKNWRRPSQRQPHEPVLTTEDEAFLREITSDPAKQGPISPTIENDTPLSPVSPVPTDTFDATQSPVSPAEEFGKELGEEERKTREKTERSQSVSQGSKAESSTQKKRPWSWIRRKSTVDKKGSESASEAAPAPSASNDAQPAQAKEDDEAKQEAEDMTEILERLNLAAENNRVFSISDETRELLRKFTLIFKDLVNGVPTAYHDLEMLLKNGNKQLQSTYSNLPKFLQSLIEKLPEKWTETLAPEVLAAATEKASKSGINVDNVGKAAAAANKMGLKVPSLKELVGKPAALVGMLRSIMAFLRARFPAVLGMNVLWSMALFILLFVLWYCHKRGREVRLENERLVTEEEIGKLNDESPEGKIRNTETLTTTAPRGASAAEIRQGVKEVQQAREAATTTNDAKDKENEPKDDISTRPKRSKSILSIWPKSDPKPTPAGPKIEPYPGT